MVIRGIQKANRPSFASFAAFPWHSLRFKGSAKLLTAKFAKKIRKGAREAKKPLVVVLQAQVGD
jgi:hypothetical protein